jgi:rhodanese-related sulfurtransferase
MLDFTFKKIIGMKLVYLHKKIWRFTKRMKRNMMLNFGPFKSLSTDEFIKKVEEGYHIIDIRRADEWEQTGIIEGSHKMTFFDEYGQYDVDAFLEDFTKVVKDKEEPFILVCAHANRTKNVGELLGLRLKYKNVYELDGGINWGWIDKGHSTVR